MRAQRLFPSALAISCASLMGCVSVERQCDMKADYQGSSPMAVHGTMQLSWDFGVSPDCGTSVTYGCTKCKEGTCFITLREPPPSFNDVCGLARFAHEFLGHGMGKRHDGLISASLEDRPVVAELQAGDGIVEEEFAPVLLASGNALTLPASSEIVAPVDPESRESAGNDGPMVVALPIGRERPEPAPHRSIPKLRHRDVVLSAIASLKSARRHTDTSPARHGHAAQPTPCKFCFT